MIDILKNLANPKRSHIYRLKLKAYESNHIILIMMMASKLNTSGSDYVELDWYRSKLNLNDLNTRAPA